MCSFKVGGGPNDPNQPTSAFRIPWGVQMFPAVILFVGLFFLPYSPRWLASKDRWEEALQVLASLHDGDPTNPKVLAQYQEIKEALEFERTQAISSYKALVAKGMIKRVALGMSVQAWSQLCGMNIMMYYIVYIMQGAGIGSAVGSPFRCVPARLHFESQANEPAPEKAPHGLDPVCHQRRHDAPCDCLPRQVWPTPCPHHWRVPDDDMALHRRRVATVLRPAQHGAPDPH